MRTTVLIAALATSLALPATALGATPPPQVVDPVGDANGINGQAMGLPLPSTVTPADVAVTDIVSVRFTTVYKTVGRTRVPKRTQVVLQLADAPQDGVDYQVLATVPATCDGTGTRIQLTHLVQGPNRLDTASCLDDSTLTSSNLGAEVVVDTTRHTITWTFDAGMRRGQRMTDLSASTSAFVLGVFDEATSSTPYVFGR
jgi:hypothetical protein